MSSLISTFAISALIIQVAAVVVWGFCYKKVNMQVWTAVFLGFLIMFLHRVIEILRLSETFSVITANGIALVALIATLAVYRFIKHVAALRKTFKLEKGCVAEKLAKHLSDLRDEIQWYENQAKASGQALYPKRQ